MIRREVTIALVVCALISLSGCAQFISGEGPLELEADAAYATDEAIEDAEYELVEKQSPSFNETVTAGDLEREVRLTNQLLVYEKDVNHKGIALKSGSTFMVLSTPAVSIGGESVSPITEMDQDEVIQHIASRSNTGQLKDIEKVDEYAVVANGDATSVSKYEATATVNGNDVDVYLHLTTIEKGEDAIVAVGVYPALYDSQGHDEMKTLMEGIEHPSDS